MRAYNCKVQVNYHSAQSAKDDVARLRIVAKQYDRCSVVNLDTTKVEILFMEGRPAGERFSRMAKEEKPDLVERCEISDL